MRRVQFVALGILVACALAAGCTRSEKDSRADETTAHPGDFGPPSEAQAADKAYPPGDRTPQALRAVAARGKQVVAVGSDQSSNVRKPLFLSSDDGGTTWHRRQLDEESVERSGTSEGATGVAAGPSGFVVTGNTDEGPVVWTSGDGVSWRRLPDDRKVFAVTDSVSAVTSGRRGFAMVGTNSVGSAGSPNQLVYWSSADGSSWQRRLGPAIGLKPTVAGSVSAAGVASQGSAIVVSGGVSTPDDPKQSDRLQFWSSMDGGNSFRASAVKGDIASHYRVYNNVLTVGDGKFVALAQGGGFDEVDDSSWDGVVLEGGPSGSSWQVVAKPWILGSNYDDIPSTLSKAAKDWVAASQMTTGTEDLTIAAGPSWRQLADRTDAGTQRGRGDQFVAGSAAIGDDVVLVGSNNRSGTSEAAVWLYHDESVRQVALPAEASGGRPSTWITGIRQAGTELVAVGDVSDAPTAWTRSGSDWHAMTLPGRTNGVGVSSAAVTGTADGRVVAVGEKNLAIGSRATVWIRATNGTWAEVDAPAFGVQARSPYGGPTPRAVAVGRGGWVIVGDRHDGDGHFDPWVVHSTDGRTWTDAQGGRQLPASSASDPDTRRTPWQNLRSVSSGAAWMNAVLPVGKGFVAAGDPGDSTAAVWLSSNGVAWSAPIRLPNPRGVHDTDLAALSQVDQTLVAVGRTTRHDGDTSGGWTSWTSDDSGKTWQASPVVAPTGATAVTLVAVPEGLLALGNQGEGDELDAAAWFTRDGRSWRLLGLPGDRVRGLGRQSLEAGVVHNGKVLVTASDVPPVGGGYYTFELDLPK
ncbi:sialidase family protein [Kribbella sp. NPDC050820]|uniref:sialidase family protein n=1 Tax=Kribbella sp. NPDC050820 TaxID=3155408 RepID=UPI0033EFD561